MRPYLLFALAFLALPEAAHAQQSLDAMLAPIREQHKAPALAAAVVRNGKIIAAGAVGTRMAGGKEAVKVTDRFHLGSDTKAFTATLAGQLVDAGKLSWTTRLGDVLGEDVPGMNTKLAAVTLEQLLSHSSGIPSDNDDTIKLYFNTDAFEHNLNDLRLRALKAWKDKEPVVPSPSPFQYSNLGYIIAGAMIEKAAGAPWEQLITERIFVPMRLRSAGLGAQATMGKIDAAIGHQTDGSKITPIPWGAAADAPPMIGPAGNAHMSVLDFAAWAGWNAGAGKRGPALVKRETLAAIHRPRVKTPEIANPRPGTPSTGEYAFGWGLAKFAWTARPVLTHNGSNSLMLAKILVDTQADFAVVVMTNFAGEAAERAASAALEAAYKRFAKP